MSEPPPRATSPTSAGSSTSRTPSPACDRRKTESGRPTFSSRRSGRPSYGGRRPPERAVRGKLYGLFKDDLDPQQRGRDFEAVLNELFQLDGISLRESFHRKGKTGKVVEQIDGAVEIAGHLYLVEAKWHQEPIGVQDVQVLISRLFVRPGSRGIFISANGFSPPAVNAQREAASQKVLLLCDLFEIVQTLEREESVGRFFKERANRAVMDLSSATASQ